MKDKEVLKYTSPKKVFVEVEEKEKDYDTGEVVVHHYKYIDERELEKALAKAQEEIGDDLFDGWISPKFVKPEERKMEGDSGVSYYKVVPEFGRIRIDKNDEWEGTVEFEVEIRPILDEGPWYGFGDR